MNSVESCVARIKYITEDGMLGIISESTNETECITVKFKGMPSKLIDISTKQYKAIWAIPGLKGISINWRYGVTLFFDNSRFYTLAPNVKYTLDNLIERAVANQKARNEETED